MEHRLLPDNTPVIVGAGQCVEHTDHTAVEQLASPMELGARAAMRALADAGLSPDNIDTLAFVRLFADAAKAWACPFGGSNNPPASIARRIGADPTDRIYSNVGGTEPLSLLAEFCRDIAAGEREVALLCGAEAIATQRLAERTGVQLNWSEHFDLPLDDRVYLKRFAAPAELSSGMSRPVHFYALIENAQAHGMGHDTAAHRSFMAELLAPFCTVASANPLAQFPALLSAESIADLSADNYELSVPYYKRMIAQDAVNQSAAIVVTSAGKARKLGIHPAQWLFISAYAEGEDNFMYLRPDPARSAAMQAVLHATLQQSEVNIDEIDLLDLYSCFPCAVQAARECLQLSAQDTRPLTVTGGLPFFGGPGNNYSLHALAEVTVRLRSGGRALVYANGGTLSKHAAAVLSADARRGGAYDWGAATARFEPDSLPRLSPAERVSQGSIVTWTVINRRSQPDRGVILGQTAAGQRFLAASEEPELTAAMRANDPIGRRVQVISNSDRWRFSFT
ncbi:MAG: hypothetical protein AAGA91_06285 [Pseudomonadota bacterium]